MTGLFSNGKPPGALTADPAGLRFSGKIEARRAEPDRPADAGVEGSASIRRSGRSQPRGRPGRRMVLYGAGTLVERGDHARTFHSAAAADGGPRARILLARGVRAGAAQ